MRRIMTWDSHSPQGQSCPSQKEKQLLGHSQALGLDPNMQEAILVDEF